MLDPLEALFAPRRVAVVGASEREGSLGAIMLANLARFRGEVIPVTRSARRIGGRRAYPSLSAIPGQVDLAVVAVPAAGVPGVLEDAGVARVPTALVLSGGFAEAGPAGAALQEQTLAAARAAGVRIVGPNCFGVQNPATGLNASMATGSPPAGGDIALVTQSGAYGMAITTLGAEQDLRFSKVYSSGNKADLRDAEVLAYLGADPESGVLCCFLESLEDGQAFCEQARQISPRKPIVAAKTGRTVAGARAAASHTAAIASTSQVWRAAPEQAGVVVVGSGLEMVDVAKALDWQPVPAGPRVGIVTNSGGIGVELTDLLVDEGLVVPELSPELQARLADLLPANASPRNPVDLTPVWKEFSRLYPSCLDALAGSGEVDAVVLILVQRAALDPAVASAVADCVAHMAAPLPTYVCAVAPREAQGSVALLQTRRVPVFDWPQRTARALGAARRYGQARAALRPASGEPEWPAGLPLLPAGLAPPEVAAALAGAFAIDVPAQALCSDHDEAVKAATTLGLPVVAKLVSPGLVHKSDAGAVRTGLRDEDAVRQAATDLLALDPDGTVLIQAQVDGVEMVVGGYQDPQFGPVVMVGLGGVLVEVLGDTVFRLAPIDEQEAANALRSLRGYPVLEGVRGRPGADLAALARTVAAASRLLAALPEVSELDLNPVIAGPGGTVAVDVRVVTAS